MTEFGKRSLIVGNANTIHDPAICIVDGPNIFCESLERHMQCKRAWDGNLHYSARAIKAGLSDLGGLPIEEADIQLLSTWNIQTRDFWKAPSRIPLAPVRAQAEHISQNWRFESLLQSILSTGIASLDTRSRDASRFRIKNQALDHHLCHAANACLTSPFDECVVMVLDGFGEEKSSSFYHFKHNEFVPLADGQASNLARNAVMGSFGTAYAIATMLCGFSPTDGEEWKVMGLAGYGGHNRRIYDFFRERTEIDGLNVEFNWATTSSLAELEELIGGFRAPGEGLASQSADLAHNFQLAWEDTLLEVADNLGRLGLSRNLAYGGGCALNSSTNGKILARTSFERLHVPSAPADDGNALGAVLYHRYCVLSEPRDYQVFSPYLGSVAEISNLERVLSFGGIRYQSTASSEELCELVSDLLVNGAIIGWMQGRAEFGPRALGNRSILADPRPRDMKARINQRVKYREDFRPIAPSILVEHGERFFIDFQESPYMERALTVKSEVRDLIPAVVHADFTARLHTVRKESNGLYYSLIESFFKKTGIPVLVNTSLNVMGKPIVHSVDDALAVFYTSGLDAMAIGRHVLTK